MKSTMMTLVTFVVLVFLQSVVVVVTQPTPVAAGEYQLTLVAAEGDMIDGRTLTYLGESTAALNSSGDVVFSGYFSGGHGIFNQSSILVETGDVIDGEQLTGALWPALNDAGDLLP